MVWKDQNYLRLAVLNHFTSVFDETSDTMNLKPKATRERNVKADMTPKSLRRLWKFYVLAHRLRVIKRGAFSRKPFDFAIYAPASPDKRVVQHMGKPTGLWPERWDESGNVKPKSSDFFLNLPRFLVGVASAISGRALYYACGRKPITRSAR